MGELAKLYVFDLDMTLLRSDLTISQYTIDVWNKMVSNGYLMSIATARSLKKTIDFTKNLTFNTPLILLDGGLIADKNGKILYINKIDKSLAQILIDDIKYFGIEPFIVGFDNDKLDEKFLYPKMLNKHQEKLILSYKNDKRLRAKKEILPLNNNLKIVYMGEKELLDKIESNLIEKYNDIIEVKNHKDVYFKCNFLTILAKNADKSNALEKLCEITNIKLDEVCVFGDNYNDIGMFKKSKCSIAVNNSVNELKNIATKVLDLSNDEDGVAKYLEKEVLNNKI